MDEILHLVAGLLLGLMILWAQAGARVTRNWRTAWRVIWFASPLPFVLLGLGEGKYWWWYPGAGGLVFRIYIGVFVSIMLPMYVDTIAVWAEPRGADGERHTGRFVVLGTAGCLMAGVAAGLLAS